MSTCDICYMTMQHSSVVLDECGHVFCRDCVRNVDTCPYCRAPVVTYRRVFLPGDGERAIPCDSPEGRAFLHALKGALREDDAALLKHLGEQRLDSALKRAVLDEISGSSWDALEHLSIRAVTPADTLEWCAKTGAPLPARCQDADLLSSVPAKWVDSDRENVVSALLDAIPALNAQLLQAVLDRCCTSLLMATWGSLIVPCVDSPEILSQTLGVSALAGAWQLADACVAKGADVQSALSAMVTRRSEVSTILADAGIVPLSDDLRACVDYLVARGARITADLMQAAVMDAENDSIGWGLAVTFAAHAPHLVDAACLAACHAYRRDGRGTLGDCLIHTANVSRSQLKEMWTKTMAPVEFRAFLADRIINGPRGVRRCLKRKFAE